MYKVLLINAHTPSEISEGKLNKTLIELAASNLKNRGYTVQHTTMLEEHNPEEELGKHLWADALILQSPVNWMGVPWKFKKYMDEVYTSGMDGRLASGDGRSRQDEHAQYGSGGQLLEKKYMLSLTYNAPAEAFGNPKQHFLAGRSSDDLFLPLHLCYKFFGMSQLKSFCCYDVIKNPRIEEDIIRFDQHLREEFPNN